MKLPPEIIYLTPDREDPDYIIWQGDQPNDSYEMAAYIRADSIDRVLAAALGMNIKGD